MIKVFPWKSKYRKFRVATRKFHRLFHMVHSIRTYGCLDVTCSGRWEHFHKFACKKVYMRSTKRSDTFLSEIHHWHYYQRCLSQLVAVKLGKQNKTRKQANKTPVLDRPLPKIGWRLVGNTKDLVKFVWFRTPNKWSRGCYLTTREKQMVSRTHGPFIPSKRPLLSDSSRLSLVNMKMRILNSKIAFVLWTTSHYIQFIMVRISRFERLPTTMASHGLMQFDSSMNQKMLERNTNLIVSQKFNMGLLLSEPFAYYFSQRCLKTPEMGVAMTECAVCLLNGWMGATQLMQRRA